MSSIRRPSFRRPTSTKFCMWGRILDIFLAFKFHWDRLNSVGAVGGRNFGLPIDLAHRLYNCLLLPHKPWLCSDSISDCYALICWAIWWSQDRDLWAGTETSPVFGASCGATSRTVVLGAKRRPKNCCLPRRRCSVLHCCHCELLLLLSLKGSAECWTPGCQYRELPTLPVYSILYICNAVRRS